VIEVTEFKVLSLDIDHLDLSWTIAPTNEDLGLYSVTIERSEAISGPWETIISGIRDVVSFRDNRIRSFNEARKYFYRLTYVHSEMGDSRTFGPEWLRTEPCLEALELARLFGLKLQEFVGRKGWVFRRRNTGQRCGCVDPLLDRRKDSNCRDCWGTGWIGGYYVPVEAFIKIEDTPTTLQGRNEGDRVVKNTPAQLATYPPVNPRDLIVDNENRRWRVHTVFLPTRLGSPVRQDLKLHKIPETSMEYKIDLPVDIHAIQATPYREHTLPSSLP